jgi:hypothetical protein
LNQLDSMEPTLIRGGATLWTDKNRASAVVPGPEPSTMPPG